VGIKPQAYYQCGQIVCDINSTSQGTFCKFIFRFALSPRLLKVKIAHEIYILTASS
jgi:hypothetical protein